MMGAAFGLGFVIGPVLGGFLGEFGPRVPFFVTAAMVLLNLLLGLVLLPESCRRHRDVPSSGKGQTHCPRYCLCANLDSRI